MIWVITGLFYGLFMSFYTYINQNNKINGYLLGVWRGFGLAFVSVPLILITPIEWDFTFFIMLFAQGIMTGFYDSRIFFSSAKYGAVETSKILVLSILLSMIIWWSLHISLFIDLWHRPFILMGILLSILSAIISYLYILKTPISKELFKYMLPTVFVWSFMSTLTQFIMQRHHLVEGIIYYLFYVTLISGFYNLIFLLRSNSFSGHKILQEMFQLKVMNIAFLLVFFSALLIVSKSIALNYTPNTGYVNALSLTSPLWIMLYDYLVNKKTFIAPKASIFMLVSLFFLSLFASL